MKALGLSFGGLGLLVLLLSAFGPWGAQWWLDSLSLQTQVEHRLPQSGQPATLQAVAERAQNLQNAWALDGQPGGLELPLPEGDFTVSFWYAPTSLERPAAHDLINLLWIGQNEPLGTSASLWLDSQSGKLHLSTDAQALWVEPGYHQRGRPVWVVLTSTSGRYALYLDLTPQPKGVMRAAPKPVAAERLFLGSGFQPQTAFTGLIGAPRLWKRALSPDEVADLGGSWGLKAERWARALVWEASLHQRLVWSAGYLLLLGLALYFAGSLQMALAVFVWQLRQIAWSQRLKLGTFAVLVVGWYFLA